MKNTYLKLPDRTSYKDYYPFHKGIKKIQSADGSISFKEEETVQSLFETMNYDLNIFLETVSHLGAMSVEHLEEVVNDAIDHVKSSFRDDGKKWF